MSRLPRAPLIAVCALFAAGIWLDRFLGPLHFSSMVAAPALCAAIVIVASRIRILRTWVLPALAAAILLAGAARHEQSWNALAPDDLARLDWGRPTPAWLRGTLCEVPEYQAADPAWDDADERTRLRLQVRARNEGDGWQPASGCVLVGVNGDRRDLAMGQAVEVVGVMEALRGPSNPGEADMRERWRMDGIRLRMKIEIPEGVARDVSGTDDAIALFLGHLRSTSADILARGLDSETAPIAGALLLGRREQIDQEVNDAFMNTGTMHLLAISGLHMQALATLVGFTLMLLGLGPKRAAAILIVAVVAYAILVGARASVVRSAAMCVVLCLGVLLNRPARPANLLALAGLVTLAINPTWLFDTGCQLSFLSVGAIFWCVPPVAKKLGLPVPWARTGFEGMDHAQESVRQALDRVERTLWPRWKRWLWRLREVVLLSLLGSFVISLVNAPLTAERFHVVSIVGILLNVPLVPLSMPTLAFSGIALFLIPLGGPIGSLAAQASALLLRLTVWLVKLGARWRQGSWFVAGPGDWWVLGFYALLIWVCISHFRLRSRGWTWAAIAALCAWSAWGIWRVVVPAPPSAPRAVVLAVDHGLSVVIQSPTGETMLYDCGRIRDRTVGRRLIAPALWALGVRELKRVVLSHADSDHFSGLPALIDRFAIGEVCVSPAFEGGQEAASALDQCRARGIPVRELTAGETFQLASAFSLRVLHPPRDFSATVPNNARSLIIDVRSDEHSLLLTGDIEGEGLRPLLAQPQDAVDVLLAPHHGGASSNVAALYAWCNPFEVVVSQKRPDPGARDAMKVLAQSGRRVHRTWRDGAIALNWTWDGIDVSSAQGYDKTPGTVPFLAWEKWDGPPAFGVLAAPLSQNPLAWTLAISVAAAGIVAALLFAIIEWGAWALVAPGRRRDGSKPSGTAISITEVTARAFDEAPLWGRLFPPEQPPVGLAVLLHGFAEDGTAMLDRALMLRNAGWAVLVADSRARGRSGGEFCTFGAYESRDVGVWIDAVHPAQAATGPIVLWGRSMGAAIALRAAASDKRVSGLILEAPYSSLRASVAAGLRRRRLPAFLAGPLLARATRLADVSLEARTPLEEAANVQCPVLVLAGQTDPIAPIEVAKRLARAFSKPSEFLSVPGAGHQDVFEKCDAPLREAILRFLARLLAP